MKTRPRHGARVNRPKQPSGGKRAQERKALGYALLNVPAMTILVTATQRADMRAAAKAMPPMEGNVEVALWPLGVDGIKETLDEPKTEPPPG